MSSWLLVGCLVLGFGIGSVPTGHLVAGRLGRGDLRRRGSGSTGAANVFRVLGLAPAVVTLAVDAAKGAAVTVLARGLLPGREGFPEAAGVAAVLGHVFPPWLRCRGGKGVATAAGMLAPLAPIAVLLALASFGLVFAMSRRVSAGSLAGALSFPAWAALLGADGPVLTAGVATAAILLWSHRENVARLVAGSEPRLRRSLPGDAEDAE